MESAAATILKRAVYMDQQEQYTMARELYQEGLGILLNSIRDMKDAAKKKHMHAKINEYMDRAEKIKNIINERKTLGQYRELTKIEAGSTGHGYATVFGRFLDHSVTHIHIEDPYIRTHHQCLNLVRLCELVIQKCPSLSKISLVTTYDLEDRRKQEQRLQELSRNLATRLIHLDISFSDTLHDRLITLSNGWNIKIGRGLDYFKAPEGKFVLGVCDLELRPCHETTVDIFHKSHLK